MTILQIKQLLKMTDLVQYLNLRTNKTGKPGELGMKCPFHEGSKTSRQTISRTTMRLYTNSSTAYCFSTRCVTHGHSMDVIAFIKQFYKTTDHEAIMKCKQIIHQLGLWPTDLHNPFLSPSPLISGEGRGEESPYEKTEKEMEMKKEPCPPTGETDLPAEGMENNNELPPPTNHINKLPSTRGLGKNHYGQLCYITSVMQVHLLGEPDPKSLNSLRIGLLVQKNPHLHAKESFRQGTTDLYHYDSLQKMISKIAELLSIGTAHVTEAFAELIEHLEQWKLAQPATLNGEPVTAIKKVYILNEAEKAEAFFHLQNPNLLQWLFDTLPATGIIGEQSNAMIIVISMGTCRLSNPVSVTCLSPSGMGKSYTMDKCAECMPDEWVRRGTSFSEQSFYHYGRTELKHTIFLLEDTTGIKSIEYVLRQLISSHLVIKHMAQKNEKTGKIDTVEYPVEGPLGLYSTTTADKQYTDNSNRVIEIYLDGSKEQDTRIADYQKKVKAALINREGEKALQQLIKNMYRMLFPHKIINPYAVVLDIPEKYLYKRRGLQLLLHFIDGITHLCQYQQATEKQPDVNGEVVLITHPEHIEWGFKLLREPLFRKSDELTKRVRELFEQLKTLLAQWNKQLFSMQEVRKVLRMEPRTLNKYLAILCQYGFIKIAGGKKNKTGYRYEINDAQTEQQLKDEINQHIQKVMQQVWAMYEVRMEEQKNKNI
jgi:DNA primase